jgi:outer membrane protein assembly factor BamB
MGVNDMKNPVRIISVLSAIVAICMLQLALPGPASGAIATNDVRTILSESGIKGGLVVVLGCDNGRILPQFRPTESYLVHGLDTDAADVTAARISVKRGGLYGPISVALLQGKKLPYIDGSVNLLAADGLQGIAMNEVRRVLAPNGVAMIKSGNKWEKTVKRRSKDEDDWTHFLHGPDGNPVSKDMTVGPPRHLQWIGSPRWSRHHDHMASMEAVVSAGGRIFCIVDEGSKASIRLPSNFNLVARDAYSGTLLWKRPIEDWNTHMWSLKAGPTQLTRRLVAVGEQVYVTLGINAPVEQLDAATGETIKTYEGSESTEEIILSDGTLFLMTKPDPVLWAEYRQIHTYNWDNSRRSDNYNNWDDDRARMVLAYEAKSGVKMWTKDYEVAPMTLVADSRKVYFYDGERLVSLDRQSGRELWKSPKVGRKQVITTDFGPRLIVRDDVVVFAGGDRGMSGFSGETGEILWTANHPRSGHNSLEDLMIVDGLVWSGAVAGGQDSGVFTGRDLHTGKVIKEFPPSVDAYWFHHRCYPAKATEKYLLPSRTGIEFIDHEKEEWEIHHWVRGGCIYGIMPSNGLVVSPPHPCGCYLEAKMYGINALAPTSKTRAVPRDIPEKGRLEKGPAYADMQKANTGSERSDDWPTYRSDPSRSGSVNTKVSTSLEQKWLTGIGDKLSAVVVAGGRVYVSSINTHTVYALDENDGHILWNYTTGARVDSPPTIYKGRVLFGSADGYVYCVRATDGELVWRYRAAPVERNLVAFEQVESAWPVHGSVLVINDELHCTAGRTMFLDGGLRLLRLNPVSGSKISETILDDQDPISGNNIQEHIKGLNGPVALSDVLSSDGKYMYMRSQPFEFDGSRPRVAPLDVQEQLGEGAHLFSNIGLLDDTQFHRGYWVYGRAVQNGYGGWALAGRYIPAGRILAFDNDNVYGYGRQPEYYVNTSVLEFQLYSAPKRVTAQGIQRIDDADRDINAASEKRNANGSDWKLRQGFPVKQLTAVDYNWQKEFPPMKARAMAIAGNQLIVAGPPDLVDEEKAFYNPDDPNIQRALDEQDLSLKGKRGAILWMVNTKNGNKLTEMKLESPPVFDGMAVAGGKIFMATLDGRIICLGDKKSGSKRGE